MCSPRSVNVYRLLFVVDLDRQVQVWIARNFVLMKHQVDNFGKEGLNIVKGRKSCHIRKSRQLVPMQPDWVPAACHDPSKDTLKTWPIMTHPKMGFTQESIRR